MKLLPADKAVTDKGNTTGSYVSGVVVGVAPFVQNKRRK